MHPMRPMNQPSALRSSRTFRPASRALIAAIRALNRGDSSGRHDPDRHAILGIDDGIRLDVFGDRHAKRQSASSCSVGARFVTA